MEWNLKQDLRKRQNMIDLLEFISKNGAMNFFLGVVLALIALKELYEFAMWGVGGFYNYHKDMSRKEKLVETVQGLADRVENLEQRIVADNFGERVPTIEEKLINQDAQLDNINKALRDINKALIDIKADNDKTAVAEIRSILHQLYDEGVAKGYTTQSAMETFVELSDIYLSKNGNSIFKSYIIPEYKKLKLVNIGNKEG